MTKTREIELLEKAAKALADGINPLSGQFLYDNAVSYDEMMDMTEFMASAIRLQLLWISRGSKRSKKENK